MPKMAHGVLVGLVVCLVATIAIAADEQLDDLGFAPRAELRLMARPAGGHNEPVEVVGQWVVDPSQEWQIRVTATQDSFAYIVGYSHGDAATLIWPAQDDLSLGRLLAGVNRSFPADGSFLQASGFQAYQRVLVLLSATQLSEISSTLVRIEAQGGKDQQVRLALRPQSIEAVSSHVLIPLDTESDTISPTYRGYVLNQSGAGFHPLELGDTQSPNAPLAATQENSVEESMEERTARKKTSVVERVKSWFSFDDEMKDALDEQSLTAIHLNEPELPTKARKQ